jgi:hypothetical protein
MKIIGVYPELLIFVLMVTSIPALSFSVLLLSLLNNNFDFR